MDSRTFNGFIALLLALLLCCGCAGVERIDTKPPEPFRTDGCSLFPDGDYRDCCETHDLTYWCGGTREQRREADRLLAHCVADRGHRGLSRMMYAGVRLGGVPWLPTPWRWGFGWPFGHGYTNEPQVPCEIHD